MLAYSHLPFKSNRSCVDIYLYEYQREAKKGERGFCPRGKKQEARDPKNPDEVAWPNATEVLDIILSKLGILKAQGWGFCHKSCETEEAGFVNSLRKV